MHLIAEILSLALGTCVLRARNKKCAKRDPEKKSNWGWLSQKLLPKLWCLERTGCINSACFQPGASDLSSIFLQSGAARSENAWSGTLTREDAQSSCCPPHWAAEPLHLRAIANGAAVVLDAAIFN